MNATQHILVIALRTYQVMISPVLTCLFAPLGLGCRFHPTCSQYALEAVRRHGAIKGAALAIRRLCRCHPWGGCGEDPVSEQFQTSQLKSRLRGRDSASDHRNCRTFGDLRSIANDPQGSRTRKSGSASCGFAQSH